jgi:lipopolysaccharide transport system permease protein
MEPGPGFLTRLPRHYAAARRSYADELASAARDFASSFQLTRLWSTLAVNDIAGRYRGSVLGPFWITLSQIAFVAGIGLVYGDLMHVSVEKYIPWMATGVTLWTLISGMILDGCTAFIEGSSMLRQTSLPMPLFIWRIVCRNLLNFAHQIVVIIGVAVWFHYLLKINLPMFALGFLLLLLNLTWMTFAAAVICARYRDVQQMISSALQIIFFISPVIWIPNEMSGLKSSLLRVNPVFHMLDVTRNPLIGLPAHWDSVIYLAIMAAVGLLLTFCLYGAVRRRIVHYL